MAYKDFDGLSLDSTHKSETILKSDGHTVDLPDASFVRDADMSRDGMDLVLDGPDGKITVQDYFAGEDQPNLVAPDGSTLTPDLVNSFTQGGNQYAGAATVNDESPVGAVHEVTGHATVTHIDGTTETISKGTPIFQGDVVETDAQGAVNIMFIDETSFAVSQDARLAIDEYVFDASTQSGETNFSVLKGVFVFTSGLIGRDDPDDVHIDTPVGSIGIRGTIIAGNVDTGEITVVEGAIVLKDHDGHEMTLAAQFETARFHGAEGIENLGVLNAADVSEKFFVVSQVAPSLFSSINDAAAEQTDEGEGAPVLDDSTDDAAPVDTDGEDHSANVPASDTVVAQDATVVPTTPAVPPPVNTLNSTGFETPGNFTSSMTTTLAPDATTHSTTVTATIVADTAAAASTALPPPPVAEPTAPDALNAPDTTAAAAGGGGGGGTNAAPTHTPEASIEFFRSGESQSWHYRFDKEFSDDAGATNLTYELSAQTITDLNAWIADGAGGNPDILTTGGWTFNATTGELSLNMNGTYSTTINFSSDLTIQVQARDADGAVSGYHDYNFLTSNGSISANLGTTYATSNSIVSVTGTSTTQLSGTNNKIYLGDGGDIMTFTTGGNHLVYMGDGQNLAEIQIGSRNNLVVGGDDVDTFQLSNGAARVYGEDGNDDFRLMLSGTTFLADLQTAGSNTVIDGGHSNFRAGLAAGMAIGEAGGRGDSLILEGAGTLDFGTLNAGNQISSIERIDATSAGGVNQTIILNYADILRITDDKHALVINLEGGDRLELAGMGGMTRVNDNLLIDDGSTTTQNRNYDVYTDGTVTLFISAAGAAAANGVTMDGGAVAV